jgi:hypothetical protein
MTVAMTAKFAKENIMNRMRTSILTVLVLAIVGAASAPTPAFADDRVRIEGTFSVLYMYPSAVNYCSPAGGDLSIEAQGLGDISGLGPMFVTVKKCFTFSDGTYAGTFTMTAGTGDTLTGTYAGTQEPPDENGYGPFQGTLTVKRGTGRFQRARGTLKFMAVGSPTSVGANASTATGMAFYLVKGNMSFPDDQ